MTLATLPIRLLRTTDAILRSQAAAPELTSAVPGPAARLTLLKLAGVIVFFGMLYGAVMGTFSATSPQRAMQIVYAAVKVPILLLVTSLISLPSFFVLNT